MSRVQDFLRRVIEMSYRTDYGHWVFFRDMAEWLGGLGRLVSW